MSESDVEDPWVRIAREFDARPVFKDTWFTVHEDQDGDLWLEHDDGEYPIPVTSDNALHAWIVEGLTDE